MKPLKTKMRFATAMLVGTALTLATGLPLLLGAVGVLAVSFTARAAAMAPGAVLMDITISTSSILEDWQDYYLNAGQGVQDILVATQDKRNYAEIAQLRVVPGDLVQLSNAEITDVLQGFKTNFSPKGTTTMTPVPFLLRNVKIDLSINPDDIKSRYFGFLAGLPAADRASWPIVRYIWEVLVMPKNQANLSQCDWAGEYAAPADNTTPGATLASYTGLKKIITDDLDGGSAKMNELTLTNSLTNAAQVFAAVEEAVDQLPSALQMEDLTFILSHKTELSYFRDRRNSHGNDADYAQKNKARGMNIDGRENMVLKPMNGLDKANDHGWLIVTPTRNLLRGNRVNAYNWNMESDKRSVALMADWYEGVGFGLAEEVFVVRPSSDSSD